MNMQCNLIQELMFLFSDRAITPQKQLFVVQKMKEQFCLGCKNLDDQES